ncbi:MAG: hypothetical protein ACM3UU_08155 [Ignavibacteriales bacterium]
MDEKYIKAVSEVSRIIELMSPEDREKIPTKFREFLKKHENENLGSKFHADSPLSEQEMSHETRVLLAFISDKFFK